MRAIKAVVFVALAACTLTHSFDSMSNGECGGQPCRIDNGLPTCGPAGECLVASCRAGFDDCNRVPEDGCETSLKTNASHCGQCDNVCSSPGTETSCSDGRCVRGKCRTGFEDCNHDPNDGCEADLRSDPNNCGVCGNTCRKCENSQCVLVTAIQSSQEAATTCALLQTGVVYCWGNASSNQTGSGTACAQAPCTQATPAPVANLTDVKSLAVGFDHACAVKTDGTLWCWGSNASGQLGLGVVLPDLTPYPVPMQVLGVSDVEAVYASYRFTLVRTTRNELWASGTNLRGQLGLGNSAVQASPQRITSPTDVAVAGLGEQHGCVATSLERLFCTGNNESFALGISQTQTTSQCDNLSLNQCTYNFVALSQETSVAAIAGGANHTCIVRQPSQIACVGSNDKGQLGTNGPTGVGQVVQAFTGVFVPAGFGDMVRVTLGAKHSCSLARDGRAWCWGNNAEGQLGNPVGTISAKPVNVVDGQGTALSALVDLAAGQAHTCVLSGSHRVFCFGANDKGQLGPAAATTGSVVPVEVLVP